MPAGQTLARTIHQVKLAAPEGPTILQAKDPRVGGRTSPTGGGRRLGPCRVDDIQGAKLVRGELTHDLRRELIGLFNRPAGLQLFVQLVDHRQLVHAFGQLLIEPVHIFFGFDARRDVARDAHQADHQARRIFHGDFGGGQPARLPGGSWIEFQAVKQWLAGGDQPLLFGEKLGTAKSGVARPSIRACAKLTREKREARSLK